MSKNIYIIIGGAIIIVLGGFLFLQSNDTSEQSAPGASIPQSSVTITYTNSGYSPKQTAVSLGGTVTFKNESSRTMWPATAIHPTHTIYPESGILKCGTPEEPRIFDACEGIRQGGSWSFTFQELGSWGYHDHLNISRTGKIIVK